MIYFSDKPTITKPSKRIIFLIFLLALLIIPIQGLNATKIREIRVGLNENKPLSYTDDNGKPAGITVSVLEYIAEQENWKLNYTKASWNKLRVLLEKGELDILLTVALSEERKKLYKFNNIDVFTNWAEIYVRPDSKINSLLDLKGKRISTSAKGIFTTGPEGIIKINDKFQLNIKLIKFNAFTDVLKAVKEKTADAGIVNRLVGAAYEEEFGLKKSGIVFSPVKIRFALNKESEKSPIIIEAIDRHMEVLKKDNNSIYHQSIRTALGGSSVRTVIPQWVPLVIFITVILFLISTFFVLFFRQQERKKTSALNAANFQLIEEMDKLKQTEEALNLANAVINRSPVVAFLWQNKENWPVEFVSDNVIELFGYSAEEFMSGKIVYSTTVSPDDIEKVNQEVSINSESGKENFVHEPYRIITKNGGTKWIEDMTIIRRDENNVITHYEGIVLDISKRVKAEEEKKLLEEQYHQSQKVESIGRLAGGISHDLNNLLLPILGYAELLKIDLAPGDDRIDHVNQILQAGTRARDLVGNLLAFSRKQTLEYHPVDMNIAIKEFENLLHRTIREDIEIKIITAPEIKLIMADIGQIEQVIMNLVVNAADAMPEGGKLTIETSLIDLDESYTGSHQGVKPGTFVMLSVSDSGHGFDSEVKEHIFEPFFTTKDKSKGTGLGLSTVYGIVKQHQGNIWVYSEPGKGSTFKVYLPVFEGNIELGSDQVNDEQLILNKEGTETILLAEDNEQVRGLALNILKRQGYHVLVAKNGNEALALFNDYDNPVHLLLTDVIMPEMNGRDLYNKIAEKRPDIKVLYMSGYTDNVIAHHGVLDEGINYIQKPFTVSALAIKIRDVLGS